VTFRFPDSILFTFYSLPIFFFPLSTAGAGISAGIFLLLYAASGYWMNWHEIARRSWVLPLVLFILWTILGLLWTNDLGNGIKVLAPTSYGIYALMGSTLPWEKQWLRWLIRLFLTGLFINAVLAFLISWRVLHWHYQPDLPYVGLADHIWLSMALTHALLWLLWDLRRSWNFSVIPNVLLIIIFFAQLALSPARSGQLLFVLLVPVAIWLLYRGKWRYWALGVGVAAMVLMSFSPIVQSRVKLGVQNLEQFIHNPNTTNTSWGIRLATMWAGVKMVEDHPLLGVGTGDFAPAMADLQEHHEVTATPGTINTSASNNYLSVAAVLGLPGLSLFLWFLWSLSQEAWRVRMTPQGWFVLTYLGIFWVGGMYNTLNWGYADAFTIALLAGLPLQDGERMD